MSVERETFPGLIEAGALVMGYLETAYWLDVGTPQAFVRGSCDLVLGRLPAPAVPGPPGPSLVLAGAVVTDGAEVSGGTAVGAGASVGAGRDGLRQRALRRRRGGRGRGGRGTRSSAPAPWSPRAPCCDDAVIGDGAYIGAGNELARGIRVWPGTRLEPPRSASPPTCDAMTAAPHRGAPGARQDLAAGAGQAREWPLPFTAGRAAHPGGAPPRPRRPRVRHRPDGAIWRTC